VNEQPTTTLLRSEKQKERNTEKNIIPSALRQKQQQEIGERGGKGRTRS